MGASRPCNEPGCWHLQPCALHPRVPFGRRRTAKREYGSAHRAVRELVLERDGHRCVRCGSTTDLQLDHIDHLGPTTVANGQTLCGHCNASKAQQEAAASRLEGTR